MVEQKMWGVPQTSSAAMLSGNHLSETFAYPRVMISTNRLVVTKSKGQAGRGRGLEQRQMVQNLALLTAGDFMSLLHT